MLNMLMVCNKSVQTAKHTLRRFSGDVSRSASVSRVGWRSPEVAAASGFTLFISTSVAGAARGRSDIFFWFTKDTIFF